MPGRFFRRLTPSWAEVGSIEADDRAAVVTAIDGRSQRIDLADAFQPTAIRDALISAAEIRVYHLSDAVLPCATELSLCRSSSFP